MAKVSDGTNDSASVAERGLLCPTSVGRKGRSRAQAGRNTPRDLQSVVRQECANWVTREAGCVFGHPCHVLQGRRCRYFTGAVLPAWPRVAADYERATAQERLGGIVVQEEDGDSG